MLYLEDYLEMIEHLPQELKDRFTEIRELDLEVQNASDKLDERVKIFFQLAKKQKLHERDAEYVAIRKDYYKVLDNADEKVNQANQLYDLVDRYLRKLDHELHKFKMELEADNAGITEILEKRSLELDAHEREKDRGDLHSQKENRYIAGHVVIKSEKKTERKNSHEKAGSSGFLVPYSSSGSTTPTLAFSLNQIAGAGGDAIAAAASQAIAATQQMQQGRRTASLKASYDAVNLGLQTAEFSVGRELLVNAELHHAAQQALAATTCDRSGVDLKRNKRKSQHTQNQEFAQPPQEELPEDPVLMDTETTEWAPFGADSTEPRYCLCNEVSYGDMVACDNPDCPIEWFHYGCVGITTSPKGKWYCPQCASSMKRRGRQPR